MFIQSLFIVDYAAVRLFLACGCGSCGTALFDLTLRFITDSTNCDLFTLSCTGIGTGTLTMAGKTLAMAGAAVTVDGLQTADVLCKLTTEVTFHDKVVLKHGCDCGNIFVRKLAGFDGGVDICTLDDFCCNSRTDSIDVPERKFNALVRRDVNSNDSGHFAVSLTLFLFVARIPCADHADRAFTFDYLAVFTPAFD
jgi:hypothetical protein